jgi:hypothetical protein
MLVVENMDNLLMVRLFICHVMEIVYVEMHQKFQFHQLKFMEILLTLDVNLIVDRIVVGDGMQGRKHGID